MEEVAKHNKKGDLWVVLNGRVLNVSKFLSQHPGDELAILTFAGKDATAEFGGRKVCSRCNHWCCRQWRGEQGQGSREVGLACCHR